MLFIFYTFNFLTLCKALRYRELYQAKNNKCAIVYCDLVSHIQESILADLNIIFIDASKYRKKTSGLSGIINGANVAIRSAKVIENLISIDNKSFTLVLFRDNEPQEATIIDKLYDKNKERFHLWLIEEGTGIYADKRPKIRKKKIKQILYSLMGVSKYSTAPFPQGMNPLVEKLICAKPENLPENKQYKKIVEKEIPIFTTEFCKIFLKSFLSTDNQIFNKKFDFVFLTTPIDDFGKKTSLVNDYLCFLYSLIDIVTLYGNLLIKAHPRDRYDYNALKSERVVICNEELNKMPFECIFEFLDRPIVISLFSSANANLNSKKESYYLYKLLGIKLHESFSENYLISNNIIVCESFNDLYVRLKNIFKK